MAKITVQMTEMEANVVVNALEREIKYVLDKANKAYIRPSEGAVWMAELDDVKKRIEQARG